MLTSFILNAITTGIFTLVGLVTALVWVVAQFALTSIMPNLTSDDYLWIGLGSGLILIIAVSFGMESARQARTGQQSFRDPTIRRPNASIWSIFVAWLLSGATLLLFWYALSTGEPLQWRWLDHWFPLAIAAVGTGTAYLRRWFPAEW